MSFLNRFRKSMADARAIEAYNKGLDAKYKGDWVESFAQNKRANELRAGDEAAIWNLAIAATALHRWDDARAAWRSYGIRVNDGPGEVEAASETACVRLNPEGAAEVVWGERMDPARIRILNVPLASSNRRYGDILINDGAEEGTRLSGGQEYPVFNELGLWRPSSFSTFEVELHMPNASAMEGLEEKCREKDVWVEDWGTMRILCAACSRGNPGEHECVTKEPDASRYGFAAKSEAALRKMLAEWAEVHDGIEIGEVKLVLSGVSQ